MDRIFEGRVLFHRVSNLFVFNFTIDDVMSSGSCPVSVDLNYSRSGFLVDPTSSSSPNTHLILLRLKSYV